MSKYTRNAKETQTPMRKEVEKGQKLQHREANQKIQIVVGKNQEWRPANRDVRSYREIVKEVFIVEGETSSIVVENLKISLICREEVVLEMKEVKEKLSDMNTTGFEINRINNFFVHINKRVKEVKDDEES